MKRIEFTFRRLWIPLVSLCLAMPIATDVMGAEPHVDFQRQQSTLLLDVDQVSEALGWQAKTISQGKLLILCQLGDNGICVPIQLEMVESLIVSNRLFVDASVLQRTLGFTFDEQEDRVTLRRDARRELTDEDLPTYHADWPEGRGFEVGQTVPDIPLFDMQGREVRFSNFLGKQYILYCWASW